MAIQESAKDLVRRITSDLNLFNDKTAGFSFAGTDTTAALVRARIAAVTGLEESFVRLRQQLLTAWDNAVNNSVITDAICNTAAGQGTAALRAANLIAAIAALDSTISSSYRSIVTP